MTKDQINLFAVCRRNNVVFIRKNLNRLNKADLHIKNEKGNTPLYHSVLNDNIEVVEFLIELGAKIN